MKRVNYKRLSIQNFLSIGKKPVVIEFKKGIHIITGVNKDKTDRKNGVGKSAVACAFYFAHFGEAIRNIKKDLIVNDITNGKVEVILDVEVIDNGVTSMYQITRNLKPSRLRITKDGVDVTLSSIPKTTEYISDILGVTPSLTTNCIIMTINDTIPFMAKPKGDKRKFIEDVFDLDVFSRMVTLLKRDFRETKKLVDVQDAKVQEIKRSVKKLKEQKLKLETMKKERIAHYEKRKAGNVKEKKELEEKVANYTKIGKLSDIESNIQKLEEAVKKLTALRSLNHEGKVLLEHSNEKLDEEVAEIAAKRERGVCIECGRKHDADMTTQYDECIRTIKTKKEVAFKRIAVHQGRIDLSSEKRAKCSTGLDKLRKQKQETAIAIEDRKTDTKRLEQITDWIKELDDDIETVKKSDDTFTGNIKGEADRLRKNATELSELQEKFKVLESSKFVLGDEGVKTHIIKKLIDLLNQKLTHYIRKLDGNCICRFNEYFEEEIINTKNKPRSYFNFSGAEKKAVDLGCLFAFSDVKRVQGGVSYNVSMYDELFDSSLDETGVGLVIDILGDRVEDNDECVIIISHRKEAIKAVTGEVIYLEKKNDITCRVDYADGKL